ncbi:MAG: electron transfer flavoprotein subunit alpha/FixB family protein [Acidobacteria bacterium]|nr:electron transfer flavoprotein subunit alpha/FixB family protein [Acidobacteriota bacterium]
MKTILVIAEHDSGKVRRGSFEALALARQLADPLGARPVAALLGHGVEPLAGELARRGADEVFLLEHELLAQYTPDAYAACLAGLVEELAPEWVLMSHTYLALDMLPLVAAKFDAPLLSDSVGAEVQGDEVVFLRQPYDAKFVARTVDRGPAPRFATLQSGSCSADELPQDHAGGVTRRAAQIDPAAVRRRVLEVRSVGEQTVDLGSADVIVAGGRGLGTKEKFEELMGGLARVLDGALGASRPVVDSEWLPHQHQIGSSGQSVAPRLYLAVGISGAIQHMVGVRAAQTIVAINKDKDAPIFNEATLGIVADLNEVVPEIIRATEEAKKQ